MKPRVVDDWRQAIRWTSVHCMAAAAAVQGTWVSLPDDIRQRVPYYAASAVTIVLVIGGIIGRLHKQNLPPSKPPDGAP